ncbi:hypothetical protein M432DRAFT_601712 [Thermoascus aurantiacus ATCC 26904]
MSAIHPYFGLRTAPFPPSEPVLAGERPGSSFMADALNHEARTSVLRGLPPRTNKYPFQSIEHMERVISRETDLFRQDRTGTRSQFIIFSHVPEEVVSPEIISPPTTQEKEEEEEIIDENRHVTRRQPRICCDRYLEMLLFKMLTPAHEQAARGFHGLFAIKLAQMNVASQLTSIRSGSSPSTSEDSAVKESFRKKRPDLSYKPTILPPGRSPKWPTVVVEVGYSGSQRKLVADMKWWLGNPAPDSHSEHERERVQLAIAIYIKKHMREVIIQRWERVPRPTLAEPERVAPAIVQQTTLAKGVNQTNVKVSNAPLVLPFRKVFLRNEANLAESDFVFTGDELANVVETVWIEQDLES